MSKYVELSVNQTDQSFRFRNNAYITMLNADMCGMKASTPKLKMEFGAPFRLQTDPTFQIQMNADLRR